MSTTEDARSLRIALVGLGAMGLPMALNLLAAGHRVTSRSRDAGRTARFARAGGVVGDSWAEALDGADVVITVLPDGGVVRDLIERPDGMARCVGPGALMIDMSTTSPADARSAGARCAQLGIDFIDAPVSGGVAGAEAGTLSIMVGGRDADLERARPVLEAVGRSITHVGPLGSGQVAKAANQLLVGATLTALGEAVLLLERSGVDPAVALGALTGGLAGSRILDAKGLQVVARELSPTFTARLHAKDMAIVRDASRDAGCVLPVADRVEEVFAIAVANSLGDLDHCAVVRVAELLSGTHPTDWSKEP